MGRRPKYIFISYSRDDKHWTYEFAKALREELNYSVFVDYKGIHIGTNWWRTICENIESCDYVIYVMTQKSIDSIYCTAEIDYAVALNKPILPIMLKSTPFPKKLDDKQVQYLTIADDMQIKDILVELLKGLGEIRDLMSDGEYKPPQTAPKRPDEPKAKDTKSAEEVFDIAVDLAYEGQIDQAEILFQEVITADKGRLGRRAGQRLEQVQSYQQVARRADNPRLRDDAKAMWIDHVTDFGIDFDPFNLAEKLAGSHKPPIVTPKPVVIETPLPPKIITPTKPKIALPAPFDWCYIPEGQVTFGPEDGYDKDFYAKEKTTVPVPAFWMAKYPVTNKQYREFVTATGKKPRYWDDAKWNGDDYPVVGMTWYEAVAFCAWLSNKTGEKIMLPSDAMWQRAAQGDDERKFPWGNVWDASLCNNNVDKKGIGKTTPVRDYEDKYTHPYGLVDMAGNVWEWCLTTYKTGENRTTGNDNDWRVLTGGSWGTEVAGRFVSAFRDRNVPNDWYNENIGFRLARL